MSQSDYKIFLSDMSDNPTDKREQTLLAKYGGAENLAQKRREWQLKSRKNPNSRRGGFAYLKANDPEKLKEISRKAAHTRHEGQQTPTANDAAQA